ncbi:hypothetical protein H4R33_001360 [Dimargaris cristalligena]|nr:hypothetical protein H4R33_001360 [Dimargaris cristalligena]
MPPRGGPGGGGGGGEVSAGAGGASGAGFQLRNSAQLIAYLKAKVERQKQVLRRAKDELLNMKELKRPTHPLRVLQDTLDLVANVLRVGHPARLAAHLPSLPLMYPPQFRKWTKAPTIPEKTWNRS